MTTTSIEEQARARNQKLAEREAARERDVPAKWLVQMAHLTTPATVAKYVETAATRSAASLVMLDLEDSIPAATTSCSSRGETTSSAR